MNKDNSFNYEVDKSCDEIFDERGNTILSMRLVKWGNAESPKLELRKWYVDVEKETPNKGFSFLTPEGPHNLVKVLTQRGFGDTKEVLNILKDRKDFNDSLCAVIKNKDLLGKVGIEYSSYKEEEYYDPKEYLL